MVENKFKKRRTKYQHIIYPISRQELKYITNLIKKQNKKLIILNLDGRKNSTMITSGYSKIFFEWKNKIIFGGNIGGTITYNKEKRQNQFRVIISPYTFFKTRGTKPKIIKSGKYRNIFCRIKHGKAKNNYFSTT